MTNKVVTIYTDGACSGNPGPGGWGALIKYYDVSKEIYGYMLDTTNNRMEIMSAIEALKILKRPCTVDLYTDSKYLQKGVNSWLTNWQKNNWRKKDNNPVKNLDLWQDLCHEISRHQIKWHWVKGHSDNAGNIVADKLANTGKQIAIKMIK